MLGGGRPLNNTRTVPEGFLISTKPDDASIIGGKSSGGFTKAIVDNSRGSGPSNPVLEPPEPN
jgi:hypothetical protein